MPSSSAWGPPGGAPGRRRTVSAPGLGSCDAPPPSRASSAIRIGPHRAPRQTAVKPPVTSHSFSSHTCRGVTPDSGDLLIEEPHALVAPGDMGSSRGAIMSSRVFRNGVRRARGACNGCLQGGNEVAGPHRIRFRPRNASFCPFDTDTLDAPRMASFSLMTVRPRPSDAFVSGRPENWGFLSRFGPVIGQDPPASACT